MVAFILLDSDDIFVGIILSDAEIDNMVDTHVETEDIHDFEYVSDEELAIEI